MAPVKIEPGTVVAGRFEVEREAGRGGMGVVYRAKDYSNGTSVALKMLLDNEHSSLFAERLAREAKVLGKLRHPGIVRYVAHVHLPDGRPVVVMDWLDGEELSVRLARGPLSLSHCMSLLRQVSDALAAAHRCGVVHRDIKPSNIFLRDGGFERVVLLDFGIARHTWGEQPLTRTGMLVGTPEYMAPEQARAEREISPSADIFSFGCVLYQCITGKSPFAAEHIAAMLAKILFEESPPVNALRPSVPSGLASLIHRMLSKDSAGRPRDAAALQDELSNVVVHSIDGESQDTLEAIPLPAALTGSEQVLVSVVVANSRERAPTEDEMVGSADASNAKRAHGSLISDLRGLGARVEWLADGSLVTTLSRPTSSAADLTNVAARCALLIRERWPEAHVSLATGRGLLSAHLPVVGEAIDRAVRLVSGRTGSHADASRAAPSGVWLDDTSADLLCARFKQAKIDGRPLLIGEHMSVDEGRLLMGKPTPHVGRELELSTLENLFSGSIEESTACAVLITAVAGMGKSRIRSEIVRRLKARYPAMSVLIGRADPLSAGSPYGVLSQALRQRFGIQSGLALAEQQAKLLAAIESRISAGDARRVSEFLGELCGVSFSDEGSPLLRAARANPKVMNEEIQHAILDWLRAGCAEDPLLLVLEDLHWGDPLTMKLIEASARELSDRPFLVLVLARPEVADVFPRPWKWLAQEIQLRPLSRKASEHLVRQVLESEVSPETVRRIVEHAEGNALYLEELIRAAAEGRRAEASETLLAMLQARFSRLESGARKVLRAASVFGETFWSQGVRDLYGGSADEVAGWLRLLADAEIVQPRQESRFPGDVEYRFRHALLREAAYSLLTNSDRVTGHARASHYLENAGEGDPAVIAEHAHRGGDHERALRFYMRAAEQSWERQDMDGILVRVERCIDCGAQGEALGKARALQCQAYYWKMEFAGVNAAASEAIALLRPGSLWWCRVIDKLIMVFLQMGQPERMSELGHILMKTEPDPEAGDAYVIALSYPLLIFAFFGARAIATTYMDRMRTATVRHIIQNDSGARGWARLHEGWYLRYLEPDPFLEMTIARESAVAFEETGSLHNIVMAKFLLGTAETDMGDVGGGERTLREGVALATQARDEFLIINTQCFLGHSLSERSEPESLEEARCLAETILATTTAATYLGGANLIKATVFLAQGHAQEAELAARKSCEHLMIGPPCRLMAMVVLIGALLRQNRPAEACMTAEEGLRILGSMGGAGYSEVPFRVAAAEAWYAAGEMDRAREALRDALRQIERRASKIPDPVWLSRFLEGRPENVRAIALAREWLREEGIEWDARLRTQPSLCPF